MSARVKNGAGFIGARNDVEAPARRLGDFYPTPADVTEALLSVEKERLQHFAAGSRIWEPASGDDAIVDVLERHGFDVAASDIEPRGRGRQLDFLITRRLSGGRVLVSNPPFGLADEFIAHAAALGIEYMALLLKATFWQVNTPSSLRQKLWREYRPTIIYPLTWRPDFLYGGTRSPFMSVAWNVWIGQASPYRPAPPYDLLSRTGLVRA